MKLYTVKNDITDKSVILDDMILTKEMPTAGGSKMLEGYMSLFEAEVVTRLKNSGYNIGGKADVGEFAFDLLGESSCNGACVSDGKLANAAAEILKSGEGFAAVVLDVNGAPRRAAAQSGLVNVKPTYGTVSRYGTIPVACSGETVSVSAVTSEKCEEILKVILGHDDKDGTSLSEDTIKGIFADDSAAKKVALPKSLLESVDSDVKAQIDGFVKILEQNGVEVCEIEESLLKTARIAWNILMSAELCNNVSRYDGVKYGYRANSFSNIDELYTNSRTEAFGELLKTTIIFGSETLSTENYMKVYDKALRMRRVISEYFNEIFKEYDAVILPAGSMGAYSADKTERNKYLCFEENLYTAPASITGLPVVTVGGVQLVGKAFSEKKLLDVAKLYERSK